MSTDDFPYQKKFTGWSPNPTEWGQDTGLPLVGQTFSGDIPFPKPKFTEGVKFDMGKFKTTAIPVKWRQQLLAAADMNPEARYELIPHDFLCALATLLSKGAEKYGDRNWEKGMAWSRPYNALYRHALKLESGEEIDSDTGAHHAVAMAWNAMVLFCYWARQIGNNDLYEKKEGIEGMSKDPYE